MNDQGTIAQAATLGEALLVGITVGIYYDFFRIIRRIIRCRYATIVGQDIFFWITCSVYVFFAAIKLNGGMVRINFIAMTLAGWGVYFVTAGAVLMLVVNRAAIICERLYIRLHNIAVSVWRKAVEKRRLKQKTKKSN